MFTYKKVGGIRFWTIGPVGGSFYVSKRTKAYEPIRFDFVGMALCAVFALSTYIGQ